ncbi:MAG: tRNA preQ1(34) S-adenosylmethionine ribosyltransferase-isomerase QueA [Anaerolineae bacterium]|nr:tRNA preQ1(34) S-adenosylmethionine ribosyltransferase-isomerase QueA [Thermoflexales bacterium]MDW8407147.1 tRNA preQ1(34) S-adenosylmethionine ribosyltransferase-isomerase QueA [Anaerolineae bacterium]
MLTSELDYELPPELIAQTPAEPRDSSRLMVIERASGHIEHRVFRDLPAFVRPPDVLVANDTQVIPARIYARKPTGGKVEILLLRRLDSVRWEALVGGHRVHEFVVEAAGQPPLRGVVLREEPRIGERHALLPADSPQSDSAARVVMFDRPVEPLLEHIGVMPIPPYIHRPPDDPARYQTVYARIAGSAAAPTAGLHFTPALLQTLEENGVGVVFVTLHIGLDTFKPITEDTVEAHRIHTEWCEVSPAAAERINAARAAGGRVIAVGTTSARTLETAAQAVARNTSHEPDAGRFIAPYRGFTSIYITPGYRFRAVDALITNFHLPRSTLLAMIGAFMGMDLMWRAYEEAIRRRYRFYSFGDAMLIL